MQSVVQIERSATEQDVKKAYRRLSLQYHPDKNQDPKAVPIFLQINQAYKALTGWVPGIETDFFQKLHKD